MVLVELVYEPDCANLPQIRRNLAAAMMKVGLDPNWTEVNRSSPMATWARSFPSPSILVNRENVTNVYGSVSPRRGVNVSDTSHSDIPAVAVIAEALEQAIAQEQARIIAEKQRSWVWDSLLITLGCFGCCLPLLVASMASAGLFAYLRSTFSFITAELVLSTLAAPFLYLEGRKSGYGPFILGLTSFLIALVGKLSASTRVLAYLGLMLLVGSIAWGVISYRKRMGRTCSASVCGF